MATAASLGVGGRVGLDAPRTDAATLERAGYRIQKERTRHKDVAGRRLRSRPTCPDRGVATALWLQSSFIHSGQPAANDQCRTQRKESCLTSLRGPLGLWVLGCASKVDALFAETAGCASCMMNGVREGDPLSRNACEWPRWTEWGVGMPRSGPQCRAWPTRIGNRARSRGRRCRWDLAAPSKPGCLSWTQRPSILHFPTSSAQIGRAGYETSSEKTATAFRPPSPTSSTLAEWRILATALSPIGALPNFPSGWLRSTCCQPPRTSPNSQKFVYPSSASPLVDVKQALGMSQNIYIRPAMPASPPHYTARHNIPTSSSSSLLP